ncbi:hypothetical protein ACFFU1_08030 [Algibacter miyuki]|uniref:Right handed beta helix region n=1 Tax=Algibacter miyuki TaxID=1306933 RepID=A0ABV5GZG1_9FLAO|nr:hypothetical protein [Algibacter miyuki]MDN3666959.1 hypothetical protein [Algibacter miyuki]
MKNRFLLVLLSFACLGHAQTQYYVDNVGGNDSYTGTSENNAFRSLKHINAQTFTPGDTILFKRGGNWTGTLKPKGNGKAGNPIVISAYGAGQLPIIDAQGKSGENNAMSASIMLYNQEYWEIRNLEVQNFEKGNPARPTQKAGILILGKDAGTLKGFKFENLKISNVNGSLKTRTNGGLFFNIIADSIPENRIPTNFDGIYVNNCYFLNVDRGGFINQSFWRTRDMDSKFGELCKDGRVNNWFPSYNIIIENSKFENIGGNGLVTRVAKAPLVQNNLFVKCSSKTTGNASYPYNCDDALWQYNEACYTVYNEGDIDASGFDSDYLCKNTIIQYNYSHHNDWGGLLVCSWGKVVNAFNDGTIIRNNIFQDEKHHMIRFSGNITNTEISKNLFVTDAEIDDVMMWYKHWGDVWPDKTVLKDNIFYNEGTSNFLKLGETSNNTFTGNILYGSEFIDFNAFESVRDKKDLKSKIKEIKKVGKRRNFSTSEAEHVIQIMWPDIK